MTPFLAFLAAFFLAGYLLRPCAHRHSVEAPRVERVPGGLGEYWIRVFDGMRYCLGCKAVFEGKNA